MVGPFEVKWNEQKKAFEVVVSNNPSLDYLDNLFTFQEDAQAQAGHAPLPARHRVARRHADTPSSAAAFENSR